VGDTVKRKYDMRGRAQRAAATRDAIRRAAHELFVHDGYAATSMRAVATAAGVGERTVYDTFPSKLDLFREVLGVATAGDDQPVALRDRPDFDALLAEPDGATVIRALAEQTATIMERAGPLLITAVESSGADPDMRRVDRDGAAVMRKNMHDVTRALQRHGALRSDVTPRAAADALVALLSPHLYAILRIQAGWSLDRYRAWVEARMADALLAS
jgi:AcrR family transcriptional regulator